jgi:hypothetical protein
MKLHRILKTFKGNQTGFGDTETFFEGTEVALSDSLAAVAVAEGWAELPDADTRETKVVEPEETKPVKPVMKKGKK